MYTLELSEREELSLWHLRVHSGIGSLRSQRWSLCLGRVSFSILSPLSQGNCSPRHFHLTTIGVSDKCSVINSDWGAMCRIAVCLPPCLRWLCFSSTWAINGILGPCGLEGRIEAAQPETDGWSRQDVADWEASRIQADVAYTLVTSRVQLTIDLHTQATHSLTPLTLVCIEAGWN